MSLPASLRRHDDLPINNKRFKSAACLYHRATNLLDNISTYHTSAYVLVGTEGSEGRHPVRVHRLFAGLIPNVPVKMNPAILSIMPICESQWKRHFTMIHAFSLDI